MMGKLAVLYRSTVGLTYWGVITLGLMHYFLQLI